VTVVGLQENQAHQLIGLRPEGKQSEGDLKVLIRPRQLLLRISKGNGKAPDSVSSVALIFFLFHSRPLGPQSTTLLVSV
jgi:hypothetical protein